MGRTCRRSLRQFRDQRFNLGYSLENLVCFHGLRPFSFLNYRLGVLDMKPCGSTDGAALLVRGLGNGLRLHWFLPATVAAFLAGSFFAAPRFAAHLFLVAAIIRFSPSSLIRRLGLAGSVVTAVDGDSATPLDADHRFR